MSNDVKKPSLLIYIEDVIEKYDNQLKTQENLFSNFEEKSLVIETDEKDLQKTSLNDQTLKASLLSEPIIETHESSEQTYKQEIYINQYQPPTPEPVDIEIQEILVKPTAPLPPIHVHVNPNTNQTEQQTPSPILIKSTLPKSTSSATTQPIFYNKYVPVNTDAQPQQIIIHQYPESPPKPKPVLIEQWLPNKPSPKRVTYHHAKYNKVKHQHNRYIEYEKPKIILEVEIIRLPIIKLDPKEYYRRVNELTHIDNIRSSMQNSDIFVCRI